MQFYTRFLHRLGLQQTGTVYPEYAKSNVLLRMRAADSERGDAGAAVSGRWMLFPGAALGLVLVREIDEKQGAREHAPSHHHIEQRHGVNNST